MERTLCLPSCNDCDQDTPRNLEEIFSVSEGINRTLDTYTVIQVYALHEYGKEATGQGVAAGRYRSSEVCQICVAGTFVAFCSRLKCDYALMYHLDTDI